jgi:hypothetical protein
MKLRQKIKDAVNETSILLLGAQILIGFQFHAAFQDGFDGLPAYDRYANVVALALTLVALASLIAPSAFHRIAEGGEDSGRLHRFTNAMAAFALLPFAVSFGLDLFIAGDRVYGPAMGFGAGVLMLAMALFFWCGLEFMRRRKVGRRERAMAQKQSERREKTPLETKVDQMLTEARVILPSAQALLGSAHHRRDVRLRADRRELQARAPRGTLPRHAGFHPSDGAGGLHHRLVYAGEDSEEFHRIGSIVVTAATAPLSLGIAADVYVVVAKILGSQPVAVIFAGGVALGFVSLWHIYPLILRSRTQAARARHSEIAKGLSL